MCSQFSETVTIDMLENGVYVDNMFVHHFSANDGADFILVASHISQLRSHKKYEQNSFGLNGKCVGLFPSAELYLAINYYRVLDFDTELATYLESLNTMENIRNIVHEMRPLHISTPFSLSGEGKFINCVYYELNNTLPGYIFSKNQNVFAHDTDEIVEEYILSLEVNDIKNAISLLNGKRIYVSDILLFELLEDNGYSNIGLDVENLSSHADDISWEDVAFMNKIIDRKLWKHKSFHNEAEFTSRPLYEFLVQGAIKNEYSFSEIEQLTQIFYSSESNVAGYFTDDYKIKKVIHDIKNGKLPEITQRSINDYSERVDPKLIKKYVKYMLEYHQIEIKLCSNSLYFNECYQDTSFYAKENGFGYDYRASNFNVEVLKNTINMMLSFHFRDSSFHKVKDIEHISSYSNNTTYIRQMIHLLDRNSIVELLQKFPCSDFLEYMLSKSLKQDNIKNARNK